MTVNVKHIRDFVADVDSLPHAPRIARKRIWGHGASDLLQVDTYSIAPDEEDPTHYHPQHVEMVICWRGKGKAMIAPRKADDSGWELPYPSIDIKAGDTLVIPKGALHQYVALDQAQPANKDTPQPVEKLVLLVVHTRGTETKPGQTNWNATQPLPDPSIILREISKYSYFDRDSNRRCVRSRIWGRDAQGPNGEADNAKPFLHLTAYCFVPNQVNPEHYHPHSLELMICLQGRATVTVRELNSVNNGIDGGWQKKTEIKEVVIEEGDTVLVPEAALHQYVTFGNEDLILLASQSPHPILHILEDEAHVSD